MKNKENIYYLLLAIFILAFAFTTWNLEHKYQNIKHGRSQPQSSSIRGWMTYEYVNKMYNLPEEYLQNKLNIIDINYPNLRIGDVNLGAVNNAVSNYRHSFNKN